jgi:mRNA-degrading endonuclease RelE of RelBE toxin-antitoxin system
MTWIVILTKTAQKQLAKVPAKDRDRLISALLAMEADPQAGDVKHLTNYGIGFRRRVGVYRILFDLNPDAMWVEVVSIEKRGDGTYRRR